MMNNNESPWRSRGVLESLYWGSGLTQRQIADELGCSTSTVSNWMERHEIETKGSDGNQHVRLYTDEYQGGYEVWRHSVDGEEGLVRHHRLLATLQYDIDEMSGKHIHHKNSIPWDNRPENLTLVTPKEHADHHVFGDVEPLWRDRDTLERLADDGMSATEIGEELDCSHETVRRWMNKFDINRYNGRKTPWREKSILQDLYVESRMPTTEVADELNCSHETIRKWLDEHNIEIRSNSEAQKVRHGS